MVAVVSGSGLGLFNSSASSLGGAGSNGNPVVGRGRDRVYVNSSTGNLIVQSVDETLAALGLDFAGVRTYNSQGLADEDNNDQWRLGVQQRVYKLTGTVNTAGSTITKVFGDGAEVLYTWNTTRSRYESGDGDGANDSLTWNGTNSRWTWTDGSARSQEEYGLIDGVQRIRLSRDADGNTVNYNYDDAVNLKLLTSITMVNPTGLPANAQTVTFTYTGTNLTGIVVASGGVTQTLTRYAYDTSNRLQTVTVDLTPTDNSVADNVTYTTTYTYDGTSTRISSITQKDGSSVGFQYQLINGEYRLWTVTDAESRVTTFTYNTVAGTAVTSTAVNAGQLTSGSTTNVPPLAGALTASPAGWNNAAVRDSLTGTVADPRISFDANGNGFMVWRSGSNVVAQRYTRATNSWGPEFTLDTRTQSAALPSLSMDAAGNAIVAWVQSDTFANSVYAARYDAATGVWTQFPNQIDTNAADPNLVATRPVNTGTYTLVTAINGTRATVAWMHNQTDSGTVYNLYVARLNGSTWSPAESVEALTANATQHSIAIDNQGNIAIAFQQSDGTATNVYVNRFTASTSLWSGAVLRDTAATSTASDPRIAFDANGNGIMIYRQGSIVLAQRYTRSTNSWSTTETPLDSLTTNATALQLALDANGTGIAAWVQSDASGASLYAARFNGTTWSAAVPIDGPAVAGNNFPVNANAYTMTLSVAGNRAAVVWQQAQTATGTVYDVYAARFDGTTWSARELVEQRADNAVTPTVAIDSLGNVSVAFQQNDGAALSAMVARYNVAAAGSYYIVPSGATWQSIANAVYGSNTAAAGTELQARLAPQTLATNVQLGGFPATLTVPAPGGTSYYQVVTGDTWSIVANKLYGTTDANAIAALQAYCGTTTLAVSGRLYVPTTLKYQAVGTTGTVYQTTSVQNSLTIPTTYTQDTQGRLTSMLVAGIETRFAYDSTTGNVNKITEDPTGLNRITDFVYDGISGLLRFSRDSLGNTVQRTYNTNNQLLTEIRYTSPDPDAINSGSSPTGAMTTRFAYDAENHLRFEISADGRVTEHQYNTAGQRILSFNHLAAAYPGASAFTETDLQNWTAAAGAGVRERADYAYDWRGNLLTLTRWEKTTPAGAGTGPSSITQFVYDQRGQLLQTIDPRGSATAPNATNPDQNQAYSRTYVYDGLGRVKTAVEWLKPADADGPLRTRTTLTTYDDASRSTTVLLDNGLSTISTFDRAGELIGTNNGALGTTNYYYDAMGRLRIVKDPTDVRQFSFYDDANRLIGTVDGDGTVTEFIYDKASQVIKTVRYSVLLSSTRISSLYDGSNNPTSIAFSTLRTEAGTSPNSDQVSRNVYDNAGRLVYKIETIGIDPTLLTPIDAVTKFVYDGASRLVEEVQYKTTISIARSTDQVLPSAIVTSDNTEDRRTRHFYDTSGNRVATLDGAGYLSEFTYDNAGHLSTKFERANPVAAGLRLTGTLTQLQTSAGLDPAPPTAPTDADPDFDIATYYYYDMQGRLSATLDGAGYYTKTNYDVAGNAISTVRYKEPLTYTSRPLQSTIETDLGAMASHTQAREFDGAGRLVREINYQGTATKYEYDGVDNVLSVRAAQSDALDERWTATRYDFLGRVTQELTAEGKALIVGLGASPAPAAVEDIWTRYGISYLYDNGGRRKSATARPNDTQTNVTLYFYDNDGRLRFEINQLGERTEYKYNGLGQLTDKIKYYNRISTSGLSGGLLSSLTQTQQNSLVSSSDSTRDAKTSYTYSLRGQQLSSLTIEGAKVAQTYNTFGEADTRTVGVGTEAVGYGYTYTTRGELKDTTRGGVGFETREYDAFGRLTKVTDGRGKISKMEYDRIGRVIATVDAVGGRSTLSYDGFSRVKETFDATSTINKTSFTYDDTLLTTTMVTPEGVSVVTKETRHGETRSVTVSSTQDGTVSNKVFTYDKNGQLLTVTDGGTLVETNVYDRGGRLTDVTDARGVKTTIAYDAANRVFTRTVDTPSTQWPSGNLLLNTTYAYDGEGRVTDVTDPNNVVTRTTYDRDGRVKEVAVDPTGLNLRTAYDYNTRNDTITVTEMSGTLLPRRTQYLFDTVGRRKEEIVDPTSLGGTLNLRTQYKYDGADNVTRKIDSRGNSTWYVYDDKNRLTHTIDALGGMTYVTYDAVDRVASTRRYVAPISAAHLSGLASKDSPTTLDFARPAESIYDRYERTFYDKDGRQKYSIDGLGVVTERLFDAAGNVKRLRVISTVRMTLAYTDVDHLYSQLGAAASTIDPADHVTWNAFDARGRVEFSVSAMDGSYGSVRRYTYDGNGNVISARAFATSRALTLATDLATLSSWATANANATNDQVTRFWYDTADRQRFVLDAENGLVQTIYNDSNRTTTSISYKNPQTSVAALAAGSTAGNVAGAISTNATDDRTTISWADTTGRTRLILNAEGFLTQTLYYDNTGATSTTVYAATPSTTPNASTALATAAGYARTTALQDRTTATWVDAAGRERFTLDGEGYLAETRYLDSNSQVLDIVYFSKPAINVTDTLAQVVTAAGNTPNPSSNQITTSTFDAAGRTTQIKDADNKSEYFVYDAVGNKIKYVNKKATSSTDPNYTWTYEYDANQHLTYERSPSVSVTTVDPVTMIATEATVSIVTHNEYDAFGNVKQRTEAENVASQARVTGYEYDRLGRQTATVSPTVGVYNSTQDNETQTRIRSETSYDALGNAFRNRLAVAGAAATDGAFTYKAYDKRGRVKYEVDAKNQVTSYTYDAFGNKTQVTRHTNPLGSTTAWKTASSLLLSQVSVSANASVDRTITTKYDRLGRATRVEQASAPHYITNVGSAGGTPVTLQPTTEYQYNSFGDVIMTREKTGSSTWATSYAYYNQRGLKTAVLDSSRYLTEFSYDETGDLTKQVEYSLPTTGVADVDTFGTKVFSATGTAQGGDRETRFAYDILNRKTGETRANLEYSYLNGSGELQTTTTGEQTTTYRYDVLGNQTLVRVVNPADITKNIDTWTWYDVLGRAITIAEPERNIGNGQIVIPLTRLQRDAHGNLVQKVEYYYGTGTIPIDGSPATAHSPAADRNGVDRYTTLRVDGRNNVLATRDATGAVKSASYNERGDIAKESQVVVNPNILAATSDDITDTVVTIYKYDEVGQQTQIVESLRAGVTVTRIADYNAFGEITFKYNAGAALADKTYYEYDQLGRVWRTNADDGVDKVYRYDMQGNATVELRSRTADLANPLYTTAAAVEAGVGAANLMRTETAYDLRGNVIERRMPNFDVSTGLPPVGVNLQLSTINGVAYVNWAGVLSNTVTETFEYRPVGSTGAWTPIDIEQVTASVLGANVFSLYNAPYEYRARLSLGTEASIFAESTGTFRLDRSINTNYSSISVTPPDTSLDVQPIAIQQSGPIALTATYAWTEGWAGTYWMGENAIDCDLSALGSGPVRVFVQYTNWDRAGPSTPHNQTKFWDLATAAGVTRLTWHAGIGDQYGGLYPSPISVIIQGLTAVGGTTTGIIAQTNPPAGPPMLIWTAPADSSVTAVFKYKRTADANYSSVDVTRFGGQFRIDVANLLTSTSNYDYEIEYTKNGSVVSRRGGQMNSSGVTTTRSPNGTIADAALDAWSQNIPTPAVGAGYTLQWAAPPSTWGTVTATFGVRTNGSTGAFDSRTITTGSTYSVSLANLTLNQPYEYQIVYTLGGRTIAEQRGVVNLQYTASSTTTNVTGVSTDSAPADILPVSTVSGRSGVGSATGTRFGPLRTWMPAPYNSWSGPNGVDVTFPPIPPSQSQYIKIGVYHTFTGSGSSTAYYELPTVLSTTTGITSTPITWTPGTTESFARITWPIPNSPSGRNIVDVTEVVVYLVDSAGGNKVLARSKVSGVGSGRPPALQWAAPTQSGLSVQFYVDGSLRTSTLNGSTWSGDVTGYTGTHNYEVRYLRSGDPQGIVAATGQFTSDGITTGMVGGQTAINRNPSWISVGRSGNTVTWSRVADQGQYVKFEYSTDQVNYTSIPVVASGDNINFSASVQGFATRRYYYRVTYASAPSGVLPYVKSEGYFDVTTDTVTETTVLDRQNPHFNQQYGPTRITPVTLPANSDVVSWSYPKNNASDTVKFIYTAGGTEHTIDLSSNSGPNFSATMSALPIAANQSIPWRIEYRTSGQYQYAMANGTVTITVNGTQQNPVVSVLNQSLRYPSGVLPLPAPTDLGGEYFGWASLSPNGATVKFYLNDVETPIETVGSTRRINLASLMADVTYRYELTFTDSGASYPTARVKGTFVPAKSPGGIIGQNFTVAAPRKETVFDVTPSIVTKDLVWPPNATFYEYLEQGGQLWYAFGPRNLASGGGWVEEIPRSTEVPAGRYYRVEAFFKFFDDAQAITWPRIGGIDNTATMVYWSSSTPNTKIAMSVGDYNGTWTAYPTDASGNLINLADGTYGYRIEMRRSGATIPWGVQEGTFVRSGGSYTSVTPIPDTTPVIQNFTPTTKQSFDRWGNLLQSTDASINITNYRYNARDQLVQTLEAMDRVYRTVVGSPSADSNYRAEKTNFYDSLGRLIETQDGYDQANRVTYNGAGQVVSKRNADAGSYGGVTTTSVYDIFGNLLQTKDELDYRTRYKYDKAGRIIEIWREIVSGGFTDASPTSMAGAAVNLQVQYFKYDELGHRVSETNGIDTEITRYRYDHRGNVTARLTPMQAQNGLMTSYAYDVNGKLITETDALGSTKSWTYDAFGRVKTHAELTNSNANIATANAVTITYNYNEAGALNSEISTTAAYTGLARNIVYGYDTAGNLTSIQDNGVNRTTVYRYDAAGRRSREQVIVDGRLSQDTRIAYDGHNRISSIDDNRYRETVAYDANGNRSFIDVSYVDHTNRVVKTTLRYSYDEMNRVVNTGQYLLTLGGTQYTPFTYNARGDRTRVVSADTGMWERKTVGSTVTYKVKENLSRVPVIEDYTYDGLGRLKTVTRNYETVVWNSSGTQVTLQNWTSTVQTHAYEYDKANRVYTDNSISFEGGATSIARTTTNTYDLDGRQNTSTVKRGANIESVTSFGRSTLSGSTWSRGYDDAGNVRWYDVEFHNPDNGNTTYTTSYKSKFQLGEGYLERRQDATSEGNDQKPGDGYTTRNYNADGELIRFDDSKAVDRSRVFVNNQSGQALTVVNGNFSTTANNALDYAVVRGNYGGWQSNYAHAQYYFFANGNMIGTFGQLQQNGTFVANFDVNYTPISGAYPGATPSAVVAQTGDTLRSIAGRVYGDASLWYVIAEENGLTDPDADLPDGMQLRIPNEVVSLSNTSDSFKPFNPADALGDTTPTQPPPPAPKGCGVIGMIIMIVVMVVVTVFTAGVAVGLAGTIAPTLGGILSAGATALGTAIGAAGGFASIGVAMAVGAVSSAVTQGIGVALGIQDKFDWKQVAMGAVTAGVGGVIAKAGLAVKTGSTFFNAAANAAISNTVTQGVSIGLGLQEKFDWKSVAQSAVAAPLASMAGDFIGNKVGVMPSAPGEYNFAKFASDATSTIVTAGVRSAMGGRFDVKQVTADIFGNAIGNWIVDASINFGKSDRSARRFRMPEITPIGKDEIMKMPDTILEDLNSSFRTPNLGLSESTAEPTPGRRKSSTSTQQVAASSDPTYSETVFDWKRQKYVQYGSDGSMMVHDGTNWQFEPGISGEIVVTARSAKGDGPLIRRPAMAPSQLEWHRRGTELREFIHRNAQTVAVGADKSRFIGSSGAIDGTISSYGGAMGLDGKPDFGGASFYMELNGARRPIDSATGLELMQRQMALQDKTWEAYDKIPPEMRPGYVDPATQLEVASLFLGGGEVMALMRGARGLAGVIDVWATSAAVGSELMEKDYRAAAGTVGQKVIENRAEHFIELYIDNLMAGKGVPLFKGAVLASELTGNGALPPQTIANQPKENPLLQMSDEEYSKKYGISLLMLQSARQAEIQRAQQILETIRQRQGQATKKGP